MLPLTMGNGRRAEQQPLMAQFHAFEGRQAEYTNTRYRPRCGLQQCKIEHRHSAIAIERSLLDTASLNSTPPLACCTRAANFFEHDACRASIAGAPFQQSLTLPDAACLLPTSHQLPLGHAAALITRMTLARLARTIITGRLATPRCQFSAIMPRISVIDIGGTDAITNLHLFLQEAASFQAHKMRTAFSI